MGPRMEWDRAMMVDLPAGRHGMASRLQAPRIYGITKKSRNRCLAILSSPRITERRQRPVAA